MTNHHTVEQRQKVEIETDACQEGKKKIRCTYIVTEDEDAGQENPTIHLGCPAICGAGQGVGFHGLHLHGFSSSADLPAGANSETKPFQEGNSETAASKVEEID